jgi:hypothetical protein
VTFLDKGLYRCLWIFYLGVRKFEHLDGKQYWAISGLVFFSARASF